MEKKKKNCHCRWHDTVYTEYPSDTTRKLLELINEFGKVAGYKINLQKYAAFLHTNNKRPEREIKEAIPFTITLKRKKNASEQTYLRRQKTSTLKTIRHWWKKSRMIQTNG